MQMRANRFLLFIGNGERINKRCVAIGVDLLLKASERTKCREKLKFEATKKKR